MDRVHFSLPSLFIHFPLCSIKKLTRMPKIHIEKSRHRFRLHGDKRFLCSLAKELIFDLGYSFHHREIPHRWKEMFLDDWIWWAFLHIGHCFRHDWPEVNHRFVNVTNVCHTDWVYDLWSHVLWLEEPTSPRRRSPTFCRRVGKERLPERYFWRDVPMDSQSSKILH